MYYPNDIPIDTGIQKQNGYRKFDFSSKSIRDCIAIIEKDVGFERITPDLWTVIPFVVGKFVVRDRLSKLFTGPTKEYYECIRENENLNQQKILKLTRQVSLLASR